MKKINDVDDVELNAIAEAVTDETDEAITEATATDTTGVTTEATATGEAPNIVAVPDIKIFISNIVKDKDDETKFNIILCKGESTGRIATVYDRETKTSHTVPVEASVGMLDVLSGGGIVTSIKEGIDNRVYTSIPFSLDDLKIDYDRFDWKPRHKNKTRKTTGN